MVMYLLIFLQDLISHDIDFSTYIHGVAQYMFSIQLYKLERNYHVDNHDIDEDSSSDLVTYNLVIYLLS